MVTPEGLPDTQEALLREPIMLDPILCKQILNEGITKYTEEEVALISELLWKLAQLTVETYTDLENQN